MKSLARGAGGVGIVGCGRLGSSLALALASSGVPLTGVADTSRARARQLARRARCGVDSPVALVERCALVVLAVPDDRVAALCAELPWRKGQAVVHCSGALPLSALDAAARRGALRGCLHPLQAFPERGGTPERFAGIHCGVEGDGSLAARLRRLVRALGATPLSLAGVDRARYHAAAVLASNYVVALHAAAERVFVLAGLASKQARPALAPLSLGAARALVDRPLARALTGPLARGDVRTIERHLAALAGTPELRALYAALGLVLLDHELGLRAKKVSALRRALTRAGS